MCRLRESIAVVARRDSSVLIQGETGTGKELVALEVHRQSGRSDAPFVPVDCTTLRDSLFESQLFGHSKGAFTGAHRDTLGFARAAQGGTLLLDEVGELDLVNQAKLLRFLQDRAVVPLGSIRPIPVDLRVLAATHRDLAAMVEEGTFRQDLYYRLNVVGLRPPPLRERLEDVPALIEHMLGRLARLYDEPVKVIDPAVVDRLCRWTWPGNVRELINVVESAFVMAGEGQIEIDHLPRAYRDTPETNVDCDERSAGVLSLDQAQRRAIEQALRTTGGHQGNAARLLNVERRRLYRMVDRLDLRHLTN